MRKLLAVLALASLGLPWFSCGGDQFDGGASSGGGGLDAGGGPTASGGSGAGGQITSSTGSGGRAGGGEGGAGGTADSDASDGDAGSGTGGGAAGGGGSGGTADATSDGFSGAEGLKDDGGGLVDARVRDAASDISTSDAPTVVGRCTLGGNECPSGYECGCGGPGPGICECHKNCQSAADCSAPNAMCGCSPNDTLKICVSMCFCLCG